MRNKVLQYLNKHKRATIAELMKKFNTTYDSIRSALQSLEDDEEIVINGIFFEPQNVYGDSEYMKRPYLPYHKSVMDRDVDDDEFEDDIFNYIYDEEDCFDDEDEEQEEEECFEENDDMSDIDEENGLESDDVKEYSRNDQKMHSLILMRKIEDILNHKKIATTFLDDGILGITIEGLSIDKEKPLPIFWLNRGKEYYYSDGYCVNEYVTGKGFDMYAEGEKRTRILNILARYDKLSLSPQGEIKMIGITPECALKNLFVFISILLEILAVYDIKVDGV